MRISGFSLDRKWFRLATPKEISLELPSGNTSHNLATSWPWLSSITLNVQLNSGNPKISRLLSRIELVQVWSGRLKNLWSPGRSGAPNDNISPQVRPALGSKARRCQLSSEPASGLSTWSSNKLKMIFISGLQSFFALHCPGHSVTEGAGGIEPKHWYQLIFSAVSCFTLILPFKWWSQKSRHSGRNPI